MIRIDISDQATPALQRLDAGLRGPARRRMLGNIGVGLLRLTRQAFRDPAMRPAPWPPARSILRRTRVASGKKGGSRRSLLRDTGALYDSLTWRREGEDSVVIGSAMPYAAAHQFGFSGAVSQSVSAHTRTVSFIFGRRLPEPVTQSVRAFTRKIQQKIPARPFLPVTPDGELTPAGREVVADALRRVVESAIRRSS